MAGRDTCHLFYKAEGLSYEVRLSLLVFIFTLFGCSNTSSHTISEISNEEQVAILATEAILQLPDVPHERTRNRELTKIIELLIYKKDVDTAKAYIDQITNWQLRY